MSRGARSPAAAPSCRLGSEPEETLDLLPHGQAEKHAGREQHEHDDREPKRGQPAFALTILARAPLRTFEPVRASHRVRVDRELVVGGLDPGWLGHETGV